MLKNKACLRLLLKLRILIDSQQVKEPAGVILPRTELIPTRLVDIIKDQRINSQIGMDKITTGNKDKQGKDKTVTLCRKNKQKKIKI
jgi:hypothetical protein